MKRLSPAEMPAWPRLMQKPMAAAYLGVSPSSFHRKFGHIAPVPGLGGVRLWDRADLDAEIERCKKANKQAMTCGGEDENSWDDLLENSLQIRAGG